MRSNDIYAANKEKENGLSFHKFRSFFPIFFRSYSCFVVRSYCCFFIYYDHSGALASDAANELQQSRALIHLDTNARQEEIHTHIIHLSAFVLARPERCAHERKETFSMRGIRKRWSNWNHDSTATTRRVMCHSDVCSCASRAHTDNSDGEHQSVSRAIISCCPNGNQRKPSIYKILVHSNSACVCAYELDSSCAHFIIL